MKQRKPMPQAAVFGLIVVGALLVALVGYTLLVKPQQAKLADLTKQTAAKQQTLDQYRAEAATHQSAPKIRVADVYRLARAMPASIDMPDVLLELDQVAAEAGIQLDSISPSAPQPAAAGYETVPISLHFVGDYYSVTDLLYRLRTLVSVRHGRLEANGRLFSIDHVNLAPQGSKLSTDLTIEAYVYGGTPAAAAPAPVAAPSTDTTSTTAPPAAGASAEGAP